MSDLSSLIIRPKSFGDVEYDQLLTLGVNWSSPSSAMDENVQEAVLAGNAATGRNLDTAAQLRPYLKWPASEAAVEKILARRRSGAQR